MQQDARVIRAKDNVRYRNTIFILIYTTAPWSSVIDRSQSSHTPNRSTLTQKNTMPYTLLQTLNYPSATNRLNYSRRLSIRRPSTLDFPAKYNRSRCRLVMCRGKTRKGKKLLVFKTTGPGKTVASFKNLPCGEAGCWVCGMFFGEFYDKV